MHILRWNIRLPPGGSGAKFSRALRYPRRRALASRETRAREKDPPKNPRRQGPERRPGRRGATTRELGRCWGRETPDPPSPAKKIGIDATLQPQEFEQQETQAPLLGSLFPQAVLGVARFKQTIAARATTA